jgi:hypothetical protein
MARPFTDIAKSITANPIKNGSVVTSTTFTGKYSTNNNYVKNTPVLENISTKYGNKFYNGLFVTVIT